MEHGRALTVAVGCLLIVAGVLVYLEWWRAGELELLNERVNRAESNVSSLAEHVAAKAKPAPRRRAGSSSSAKNGSES